MSTELFAGVGAFSVIALVLKYQFARIGELEARLDRAEAAIKEERRTRERISLLAVSMRGRLLHFARLLWQHKLITEQELHEVEATPEVDQILREE